MRIETRTWRKQRGLIALWLMGLLAASFWGCKQQAEQSEVARFLSRYQDLPAAAQQESLRVHTQEPGVHAAYAFYGLGNQFYSAATETAQAAGWNADPVYALLDSAQTNFERAVDRDSTLIEAYVNLGSLWDDRSAQLGNGFQEQRQRQEYQKTAEGMYLKALTIDPDDEKANCNLGALYLKMREGNQTLHHKAMERFLHVLEVHPKSALAHYNLAIMFAEEKIYREAITEWEAAAKADPHGDIGERSRANIQIVQDLLNAKVPENLGGES
jgi:tetratricopeptide (TPR) repeat protein